MPDLKLWGHYSEALFDMKMRPNEGYQLLSLTWQE